MQSLPKIGGKEARPLTTATPPDASQHQVDEAVHNHIKSSILFGGNINAPRVLVMVTGACN